MKDTHKRIISYNGNSFYVEFDYTPREEETNYGPHADIYKVFYNEVDVTDIMHHDDLYDMENQIVDEFAEDFYYLSKNC